MLALKGLWMALTLFTITPCPQCWEEKALPWVMPSFPVIGALVGGLWWFAARAMAVAPPALHAVVIAALPWVFSGLMHLDGLMDVSDALLSRRDQAEMLRILKDPHTGAFAVISLGLLMLGQASAAWTLVVRGGSWQPLLWIPIWSRALAGLLVQRGTPMAQSGYAKMLHAGAQTKHRMCSLGLALVCVVLAIQAWPILLVMTVVFGLAAFVAVRKLGGVNGDVAGFALTLAECAGLIALCVGLL